MKRVWWSLTLALIIIAVSLGVEGNAKTPHLKLEKTAQGSKNAREERLLEVAVPSEVIVRLKQGGSYTGGLTRFNEQDLKIAGGDFSETFPLSRVERMEFQGDVWVSGRRRPRRIRTIAPPLENVPVGAFKLNDPPNMATLNLQTVLNREEFYRISSRTDRIYIVKQILLHPQEKMTVKIGAAKR